ncbi:unnamed protein product [Gadus morhua 'NCC']
MGAGEATREAFWRAPRLPSCRGSTGIRVGPKTQRHRGCAPLAWRHQTHKPGGPKTLKPGGITSKGLETPHPQAWRHQTHRPGGITSTGLGVSHPTGLEVSHPQAWRYHIHKPGDITPTGLEVSHPQAWRYHIHRPGGITSTGLEVSHPQAWRHHNPHACWRYHTSGPRGFKPTGLEASHPQAWRYHTHRPGGITPTGLEPRFNPRGVRRNREGMDLERELYHSEAPGNSRLPRHLAKGPALMRLEQISVTTLLAAVRGADVSGAARGPGGARAGPAGLSADGVN